MNRLLIGMAIICGLAGAAAGQPAPLDDEPEQTIRLAVRPADTGERALIWPLLPEFTDTVDGDAGPLYRKALQALERAKADGDDLSEDLDRWLEMPLDELPAERALATIDKAAGKALEHITAAARHTRVAWDQKVREKGLAALMPNLGDVRYATRLLCARARARIAQGRFDAAVADYQTCLAMARHVAAGETLINALVGMAVVSMTLEQIDRLIEQDTTPNLYWSLTDLPRPLVSLGPGLRTERLGWIIVMEHVDKLTDLSEPLDPATARKLLLEDSSRMRLQSIQDNGNEPKVDAGFGLMVMSHYPQARRWLLDKGWSRQKIDAYPQAQVSMAFVHHQHRYWMDELTKWHSVAYHEARQPLRQLSERFEKALADRTVNRVTALMTPALARAYELEARVHRRLAALRVIEAIRLHAARHDGQLPANLNQITEVPVPIDPLSGKPFQYAVDDGSFTLEAPLLEGMDRRDAGLRYEVNVAAPQQAQRPRTPR